MILRMTILAATMATLGGCATHVQQTPESLAQITSERLPGIYDYVPEKPLSLGEVAALTLARNGDIAVKDIEIAIAYGQKVVNNLGYLPTLSAELEKTSRSNLALSTSARVGDIDLGAVDKIPSYSSLKDEKTSELSLRWDLLNVLNTYYMHQQHKGKEDIARFNRERAAQNVVRDAMAAYYLKAANESIGKEITMLSAELDKKLEQLCKDIPENGTSTQMLLAKCDSGLSKVHAITGVRNILSKADVNLASLIRVDPKYHIMVKPPSFSDPRALKMTTDELVTYALSHRPELSVERTKINNARIEEQKAWAQMLPGVEIGVSKNRTDNPFQVNDDWDESFVRVNWNLMDQVIGAPFRAQVAKHKQALGEARFNNLIVTSIGQVYTGVERYETARSRWITNYRRTQISQQRVARANKQRKSGAISELDHLIERLNYVAQEYNYRADYAEMMDAISQLYLSIGIPMVSLIEDGDTIETLSARYNESLASLGLVEVM